MKFGNGEKGSLPVPPWRDPDNEVVRATRRMAPRAAPRIRYCQPPAGALASRPMGRIDDALQTLEGIEDGTERALQLAGLISTLFKIKGVVLVVAHELAFDSYADTASEKPEVDLAAFAGDLAPRTILEIMRGQLYGKGSLYHWTVAGIPVRFQNDTVIAYRELCRDITTNHGVVKLLPVEEITADCILAAVHPEPDSEAQARAHLLLVNGLAEVFEMNWTVLYHLCHRPDYRVGEELAQMRLAAKREVDALGTGRDHIGDTSVLPKVEAPPSKDAPPQKETPAPSTAEEAVDEIVINGSGIRDPLPHN
jgi:hypothetical protein